LQLDAEGTLYLDGEAGASLHFNAWQFVCISSTPSLVTFYVGGLPLATAVPVAMPDGATMEVGLIGTNWVGVVDDFWVLDRELTDYDVMTIYTSEVRNLGNNLCEPKSGSTFAVQMGFNP
jgi:hypothetical protein